MRAARARLPRAAPWPRSSTLTDDSAAITFDVPDELRDAFAFEAGQSLTLRRTIDGAGAPALLLHLRARRARRRGSGCARSPTGCSPRWLVREVRPGDVVEVQTPTGSFRADPARAGGTCASRPAPGITPMLSIAATVLANPDAQVTLLYGNRTTGSVMFAEELADLKNRYGPRLDLVHVLSREPRDVELFSGRLDADRLRRLLTALVPLRGVDHVWLCGPFGLIADARAVLAELGVAADKVHFELFYVDEPPPELHRPDAVVEGDVSEVTIVLDGRTTTAPMSTARDDPRRRRGHPQRPALRLQGRGLRHLPGPGHRRARSTCAATTPSTTTRSSAASC